MKQSTRRLGYTADRNSAELASQASFGDGRMDEGRVVITIFIVSLSLTETVIDLMNSIACLAMGHNSISDSEYTRKYSPPKRLIEFRAKQIYLQRLFYGESASANDDWQKAQFDLRRPLRRRWIRLRMYWSIFWGWTGIGEQKGWDFVKLLIVPLTLAFATYSFQEAAKRRDEIASESTKLREETNAKDKWRGEILATYFVDMQALIKDGLTADKYLSPRFIIAQTKTVLALQQLDPNRQRLVIQFLEASDLNKLDKGKGILYKARLAGSNLTESNLSGIQLKEADLSGAILSKAKLTKAILSGSNLDGSNLSDVDLSTADLENATLKKAGLFRAKLSCSRLKGANFSDAYLNGAVLDLSSVYSGCGNGVKPLEESFRATFKRATFNTQSVDLYRIGNFSVESNPLVGFLMSLPFINLDRVPDIEKPTAFPPKFSPAEKGMLLDNGIVKVRQVGITW